MANHLVIAKDGAQILAEILRNDFLASPPNLHLYQNAVPLSISTVAADFVESTFNGYPGAIPLNFPNPGSFDPSNHFVLEADQVTYVQTKDGTFERAYGYYVLDNADTTLLWAEQFPFRQWFRYKGDHLTLAVRLGFLSEWG